MIAPSFVENGCFGGGVSPDGFAYLKISVVVVPSQLITFHVEIRGLNVNCPKRNNYLARHWPPYHLRLVIGDEQRAFNFLRVAILPG